jgi:tryptophan synthase alpha chain
MLDLVQALVTRPEFLQLAPTIAAIREGGAPPVAVGFGIQTCEDVSAVWAAGADAAVIGSACVARVERALITNSDPAETMTAFLEELREPRLATSKPAAGSAMSAGRVSRPAPAPHPGI